MQTHTDHRTNGVTRQPEALRPVEDLIPKRTPPIKQPSATPVRVSYRLPRRYKTTAHGAMLTVSLSRQVASELGWMVGDRVSAFCDSRRIFLRRDPIGRYKLQQNGKRLKTCMTVYPGMPLSGYARDVSAKEVPSWVAGGGLMIDFSDDERA